MGGGKQGRTQDHTLEKITGAIRKHAGRMADYLFHRKSRLSFVVRRDSKRVFIFLSAHSLPFDIYSNACYKLLYMAQKSFFGKQPESRVKEVCCYGI
jgi:hypothetical protein